ncbi:hypothetical protein K2173_009348 [Erythroxylum novogranatense]|uniref:UBA domain-containing protein n=1 Tax=Erythroxylum novogranatense TaxID=1862640 RepID=A0AAV8U3N3_9ROSI|nr:hypothetical protein K2173_009348 [Erythroxylum novogranatense]
MSSRSTSIMKSKEKTSTRSNKGYQKAYIKPSRSTDTTATNPASCYDPITGTFHPLEIPSSASPPPLNDIGSFSIIDDTNEHSSSPHETVPKYDSVSNNGSYFGESEDPKEKLTNFSRLENVPGLENNNQLHERCIGYLMSKKLEALSHQLVAMGFSSNRSTVALIINDGRLEESVNWLFKANEEEANSNKSKFVGGSNLKIYINEETSHVRSQNFLNYLPFVYDLFVFEKAIVASEGDLVKAEETFPQPISTSSIMLQPSKDERDLNYMRTINILPNYAELASRHLQLLNQRKALTDKRWATTGSITLVSTKLEIHNGLTGDEVNIIMQRPQFVNLMQNPLPGISSLPYVPTFGCTGSLNRVIQNSKQFCHPVSYKGTQVMSSRPMDFTSYSWGTMGKSLLVDSDSHGSHGTLTPNSLSLAVPSSLGSSSHVDWNTRALIPNLDYTSIDWTLDKNLLATKSSGLWLGLSSLLSNSSASRMRDTSGSCISGLRDGGVSQQTSQASLNEWTSPFVEKDIFSLPRCYVTFP